MKQKKIWILDENISQRVKLSFLRDLKSNTFYKTVVFTMGFRPILPTLPCLNQTFLIVLYLWFQERFPCKKKRKRKSDAIPILCYLFFQFENHCSETDYTGEKHDWRSKTYFVSVIKIWKVSTKILILFYQVNEQKKFLGEIKLCYSQHP